MYLLQRTAGSDKCGNKRCEVCNVISEADIFPSTVEVLKFFVN